MTVTTVQPASTPLPGGSAGNPAATGGNAEQADAFNALVGLASEAIRAKPSVPTAPSAPTTVPTVPPGTGDPAAGESTDESTADGKAEDAVPVLAPLTLLTTTPAPVLGQTQAKPSQADAKLAVPGTAPASASASASASVPASASASASGQATPDAATATAGQGSAQQAGPQQTAIQAVVGAPAVPGAGSKTTDASSAAGSPTGASAPVDAAPAVAVVASASSENGSSGSPAPNGNPLPGTTPTTGGAAAAAAAPADAPAGSGPQVTSQVFPSVARLVTRGDGTQRLTLRLSPEDLGEVRVVVTVRDGAVSVTMSADSVAQEALRNGSPDLRRLLEMAGAGTTQIVVRDLPTQTSSATAPGGQPSTAQADIGTGGDDRHQPGERGTARDAPDHGPDYGHGSGHGPPRAAPRPDLLHPLHAPVPGVDLRM